MKSIGQLTELEAVRLRTAIADLKSAALRFYAQDNSESESALLIAAREFDKVVRDSGLEYYWNRDVPGMP